MITLLVTVNFEETLMSVEKCSMIGFIPVSHSQSTNRPGIPGLFASNQLLSGLSLCAVAITTKDRTPFARLERYFSVLAALSANRWEHLATAAIKTRTADGTTHTLRFTGLTARRAAFRIAGVTALRK
jgi:hypothetical protein